MPPEWPEADYGWKVTHLVWVPFHVLDVVFGVPLVFAIGGAAALTFAREGARVFLAGRTRARLQEVAEQMKTANLPVSNVTVVNASSFTVSVPPDQDGAFRASPSLIELEPE